MRKAELALLVASLKQSRDTVVDLSATISTVNGDMTDRDLDKEEGFKALFMEAAEISAQFNLADYFPYIGALDLQGLNRRMKHSTKVFDGFLEKIIEDHIQSKLEDIVHTMMGIMESGEAGLPPSHQGRASGFGDSRDGYPFSCNRMDNVRTDEAAINNEETPARIGSSGGTGWHG